MRQLIARLGPAWARGRAGVLAALMVHAIAAGVRADGADEAGRLARWRGADLSQVRPIVVGPVDPWRLEAFAMRFGVWAQDGLGFQSQAGPTRHGPGSERAFVLAPTLYTRLHQPGGVTHDIYLPVDVVTAASPDSLDAISSASRDTESFDLDVTSSAPTDDDTRLAVRWGGHLEEQMRSLFLGLSVSRELADDNAVFTASVDGIADIFDPTQYNGWDPGLAQRYTGSVNLGLSQLLSPTTVVFASYGFTAQAGTLQTTYNSVPWDGGDRVPDVWPTGRLRHALAGRLSQAIPDTRTYASLWARFYADTFDDVAGTVEATVTQYVVPELSLRVGYRFHAQTGVSFYTPLLPQRSGEFTLRTSDSDLAPFDAHEGSLTVRWYWDRHGALSGHSSYVEASALHYRRSNGLEATSASLGWGWFL